MGVKVLEGRADLIAALEESRRLARPVRVDPPAKVRLTEEGKDGEVRLAWEREEEVLLLVTMPGKVSRGVRAPAAELGSAALLLEEMARVL